MANRVVHEFESNLVWRAGRTDGSLATVAFSCPFVCPLNRLWQAMAEGAEAGDAFTVTRLQQELQDLQGGVL
ncbi:MAG: hypothetical protein WBE50_03680 [Methyloceanibacter sp.]